ncbi:MAG: DUF1501 domain-containing protein [Planctomycetales bacterium]
MLRILGNPKRLCDGVTRRDVLRAGGLGFAGLTLPDFLRFREASAVAGTRNEFAHFGQAKRCLLLFLYGSPSQIETFDMKPHAPLEIRGDMQPIPSSLPGLDVCEYLPETARIMDRVTVLRSVTHEYPIHGVAFATTGIPAIDVAMELAPHDPRHHPYFGSVVEYVRRQQNFPADPAVPSNIALPFPMSSQRVGEVYRAGPYASYLGSSFNPIWTEYTGKGMRGVPKTLGDKKLDCYDPYVSCNSESHFSLSLTNPQQGLTIDRLNRRRTLLDQFETERQALEKNPQFASLSRYQELAYSLINSRKVADALDVRREPNETRDLYGMTLFGQSCLAGRRLLEAGSNLVSVFWDEYGLAGDAWDTHYNHFPRMKEQLLPPFDRAFSGLILDLERRGMLEDTLVVVLSEHGRTPRIANNVAGGGRDHWSRVYSLLMAGGGIKRGNVVGASDQHAGAPQDNPVSPKDVLATMYHLLGIDPHTILLDRGGQRIPLVPESNGVISAALA